jgi:hypothetical protein
MTKLDFTQNHFFCTKQTTIKLFFNKIEYFFCFLSLFFLISCSPSSEEPKTSEKINLEQTKIETIEKFPTPSIKTFEGNWVVKDFIDSISLNREYVFNMFNNSAFLALAKIEIEEDGNIRTNNSDLKEFGFESNTEWLGEDKVKIQTENLDYHTELEFNRSLNSISSTFFHKGVILSTFSYIRLPKDQQNLYLGQIIQQHCLVGEYQDLANNRIISIDLENFDTSGYLTAPRSNIHLHNYLWLSSLALDHDDYVSPNACWKWDRDTLSIYLVGYNEENEFVSTKKINTYLRLHLPQSIRKKAQLIRSAALVKPSPKYTEADRIVRIVDKSEDSRFTKIVAYYLNYISVSLDDNAENWMESQIEIKEGNAYKKIRNSAFFNASQDELLVLVNEKLLNQYEQFFSKEYDIDDKNCFEDIPFQWHELDDLAIFFEADKVGFFTDLNRDLDCFEWIDPVYLSWAEIAPYLKAY